MKHVKLFEEFLNEFGSPLDDMKETLYAAGFDSAYPHSTYNMVRYKDSKGGKFDIYLDPKKPNKVTTLRHNTKDFKSTGLVGNFIGSKGAGRRFSFKTPEDLKKKLENMLK